MSDKTPPEHPDALKLSVWSAKPGIVPRDHEVGVGPQALRKKQVVARAPESTSVVPAPASH